MKKLIRNFFKFLIIIGVLRVLFVGVGIKDTNHNVKDATSKTATIEETTTDKYAQVYYEDLRRTEHFEYLNKDIKFKAKVHFQTFLEPDLGIDNEIYDMQVKLVDDNNLSWDYINASSQCKDSDQLYMGVNLFIMWDRDKNYQFEPKQVYTFYGHVIKQRIVTETYGELYIVIDKYE